MRFTERWLIISRANVSSFERLDCEGTAWAVKSSRCKDGSQQENSMGGPQTG